MGRNLFSNIKQGAALTAPITKRLGLLDRSRLSRLSQFPALTPPKFEEENPAPVQIAAKPSSCIICKHSLPKDDEFIQKVRVCRKCLSVYSSVSSALEQSADERTKAIKLEKFRRGLER
jgi:hypothetical protein